MSAVEKWYDSHDNRDITTITSRFPNDLMIHRDPQFPRCVILRLGGISFTMYRHEIYLFLEAVRELVDDLEPLEDDQ